MNNESTKFLHDQEKAKRIVAAIWWDSGEGFDVPPQFRFNAKELEKRIAEIDELLATGERLPTEQITETRIERARLEAQREVAELIDRAQGSRKRLSGPLNERIAEIETEMAKRPRPDSELNEMWQVFDGFRRAVGIFP